MVCSALTAPYRKGFLWFGCVLLLDRLVFAGILVVAAPNPMLQVLLALGRAVLVQQLVTLTAPFRNPGLQRFVTILCCFRVLVLSMSVALVRGGVTSSALHAHRVGLVVAWLHVLFCVGVMVLCVAKLVRTRRGKHRSVKESAPAARVPIRVARLQKVCVCWRGGGE
jgi:hypothetical protein